VDTQQVIEAIREDINQSLTLPGVEDVDVDAMFSDTFMAENTEFDTVEAFAEQYADQLDDGDVLGPRLDDFIQSHSDFGSWNNMRQQAEIGFMEDRLG
jgi:hypothetical protein